jgi:glycosyltransferase 2 family protein
MQEEKNIGKGELQFSYLKFGLSIFIFLALSVFAFLHFKEAKEFILLTRNAEPGWLLSAVVLQVFTYVAAGAVWYIVTHRAGYTLKFSSLTVLSVEQLSIDQIVPAAGLAGNTLIFQTMRRFGLPSWLAIEVNIIDILAFHISYLFATLLSVLVFWLHGGITPVVSVLVSAYFVVSGIVTTSIFLLVYKKLNNLPNWLRSRRVVSVLLDALKNVDPGRIFSLGILFKASFFRALIFILDGLTLWMIMMAIGVPVLPSVAFAAFVIGSIAGTVTFMPGGVGGFEIACVGALVLFGASPESAIAGTLLLRGLNLWIPLIPGLIFAHREIRMIS